MEEIGQARPALVAGAAMLIAALGCAWAWPFAIDDAWISVRYARHVAAGAGYVWNVGGPSTDGVTPLPWAFALWPVAHAAAAVVLARAKAAGAVAWVLTAGTLGLAIGRSRAPAWVLGIALLVLAVDVPAAAHAVSGMETSFATALATLAAVAHRRPARSALLAGLAATLRPELVVWAAIVAVGFAWTSDAAPAANVALSPGYARAAKGLGLAVAPFLVCAVVRGFVFGRLAPLAVLAKPSDLAHGVTYAGAAACFTLAPLLLLAPFALARARGPALVLALAACTHFAVLVVVGGDWMPYARLAVPIVPSMLLAFVLAAPHASARATAARAVVTLSLGLYVLPSSVRTLRQAGEDRRALIARASSLLAGAPRVATVDIGWASAVSEGTILDLAGVTDPEVAVLGGGHTSKRVDVAFLLAHDPEALLFYTDALPRTLTEVTPATFPRVVEARLASAAAFAQKFEPAAFVPLGTKGAGYVLFQRR